MALDTVANERIACRVTLLTPVSRGAVATIAVEGSDAANLVATHFRPASRASAQSLPIGRILFGRWRNARGTEEEIVVCRRGQFSFEVNCHGGSVASEAIIASLVADGASRLRPADWLNQRVSDPIRRAAWLALSLAHTPRVAGILLDQFRGALTHTFAELREALLAGGTAGRSTKAVEVLLRLREVSQVGRHLTVPWRVVVAGPPNVGKSSLVNAILGYDRSIVYDQPGTTRDVLIAHTALDGWPVELRDTAGLRESANAIEAEGVNRARVQLTTADLVVWVEDGSVPDSHGTFAPSAGIPLVRVLNKADLPSARHPTPAGRVRTSATARTGLDQLVSAIVEHLVPVLPEPGEGVPFTVEQIASLQRVDAAVMSDDVPAAIRELDEMCAVNNLLWV